MNNAPFVSDSVFYFTVSHKGSISFAGGFDFVFLFLHRTGSHTFDDVLLAEQVEDDDGDDAQ